MIPTLTSRPFRHPILTRTAIALFALTALGGGACAGEGTGPESVASISVSPQNATIASRAPLPLTATVRTAGGKSLLGRPIVWTSSDTAVAKVSATGFVTAGVVVLGTSSPATITATSEGVVGTASLTVLPVPVATVTPSPAVANIGVGATQNFTANLFDATALALSGRAVTWSSSDTTVATVSASGVVTARAYGGGSTRTASIQASSEGQVGTATLHVAPIPVAQVTVAPDSVAVGDTRLLTATLLGGAGTPLSGRTIVWTSSDTTVARVNPAGLAIPIQRWDGVVRDILVTATSEGITDTTTLRVLPAPVGSITVEPAGGALASGTIDTLVGTTRTISGVILSGRTITWQSSNPGVLAIDAQGVITAGTVTSGSPIVVTITATADGFSQPINFSVSPSPVAALTLSSDSLSIFPRQNVQLQAALTNASGTTLTGRTITWATSDPSVVTVNATGQVTAPPYVGTDTRIARVSASAEGHTDTVLVVVEPTRIVTVTLTPNALIMPLGTTERVSATLRDALGDLYLNRAPTWSSSDPNVATVSDSGVVTMVGSGAVTITAEADGAFGTVTVNTSPVALVPASLVAGGYHHCGLTAAGAAYCWGWNFYGQLGNGSSVDATAPVAVAGGHSFVALSGGTLHTCGIATTGETYCWGWNANGQLGDSTHFVRTSPSRVHTSARFVQLAAGFYHSCGLSDTGAAYCWGRNNAFQLGDGTDVDRDVPAPVIGGHVFAQLIGKYAHTCGLTAAGAAYCWGRNFHGAIGDSTIEHKSQPVPMLGGRTFTQFAVGWDHSCGITSTGEAYCLGRNQYGQLGNGQQTGEQLGWVRVIGVPALRDVQSGYYHMCATTTAGAAWCWGRNHIGELGDGGTADHGTPLAIRTGDELVRVGGGYGHACASATNGVIQCWGQLLGGVLGEAPPPSLAFPADRDLRFDADRFRPVTRPISAARGYRR